MRLVKLLAALRALRGKSLPDVIRGIRELLPKPIPPENWTLRERGVDLGQVVSDHGLGLVLPDTFWISFVFTGSDGAEHRLRAELPSGSRTTITLDGNEVESARVAFAPGFYRFSLYIKLSFIWDEAGCRVEYRFLGKVS